MNAGYREATGKDRVEINGHVLPIVGDHSSGLTYQEGDRLEVCLEPTTFAEVGLKDIQVEMNFQGLLSKQDMVGIVQGLEDQGLVFMGVDTLGLEPVLDFFPVHALGKEGIEINRYPGQKEEPEKEDSLPVVSQALLTVDRDEKSKEGGRKDHEEKVHQGKVEADARRGIDKTNQDEGQDG